MSHSDILEKIKVTGKPYDRALAEFNVQMKQWGIVMPKVEPLITDFGLGNFYETGYIDYKVTNDRKAGYCGKFIFVFDGQTLPFHHHQDKHETFFVLKGRIKMNFDGDSFEMGEGDTLVVEWNKEHSFTGLGTALVLEVSQASYAEDNYFNNTWIPLGGNYQE